MLEQELTWNSRESQRARETRLNNSRRGEEQRRVMMKVKAPNKPPMMESRGP